MQNKKIVLGLAAAVALVVLMLTALTMSASSVDVLQPAGDIAKQQKSLIIFTVGLSLVVVLPVFSLLAYISFTYRADKKNKNYNPEWKENTKLEVIWWGIPILIIIVLATVTWFTTHSLDPYKPIASHKETIKVQVVAMQWKWLFIYPDYDVATVNHLPIPHKTPVKFHLTADAPMSAFWVPKLGSQIYSMNGMDSQLHLIADKPGEYRGYSTNINGRGYADMTFVVKAQQDRDFNSWVKSAKTSQNMLDMSEYKKLAKPGVIKATKTYMLHDKDLYHKIMNQYMGHDMPKETAKPHKQPAMDHSTHEKEHVNHD